MAHAASYQCDSADIHISVLDTKKLLQSVDDGNNSVNLVVLTSDPALVAATGIGHRYEFLVFGVVPGSTFVTRSMESLEEAGGLARAQTSGGVMTGWSMPWQPDHEMVIGDQLAIVQCLGAIFGPDLELAVMCHIAAASMVKFTVTATGVEKLAETLVSACSSVREDWSVDKVYTGIDVEKLCATVQGGKALPFTDNGDVKKAISMLAAIEGGFSKQTSSRVAEDITRVRVSGEMRKNDKE